MSTTDPIRDGKQLKKFIAYYKKSGNIRNYCFVNLGLHTALRVSDLLKLKWQDVFDFKGDSFKERIPIIEKKTGKRNVISLNNHAIKALKLLKKTDSKIDKEDLMKIFNHSSFEITKRYLCIEQDDIDEVFRKIFY